MHPTTLAIVLLAVHQRWNGSIYEDYYMGPRVRKNHVLLFICLFLFYTQRYLDIPLGEFSLSVFLKHLVNYFTIRETSHVGVYGGFFSRR